MHQGLAAGVSADAVEVAAVAAIAAAVVADYMSAAGAVVGALGTPAAGLAALGPVPGYSAADSSHNSANVVEAHREAVSLPA